MEAQQLCRYGEIVADQGVFHNSLALGGPNLPSIGKPRNLQKVRKSVLKIFNEL